MTSSLHNVMQAPSALNSSNTSTNALLQSHPGNVDELASVFRPMRPTTDEVAATLDAVFTELVDDITLGVIFDVHRAVKKGFFFLSDTDDEALKQFEIIDRPGFDIFGQLPPSRGRASNGATSSSAASAGHINHHNLQYECPCPNCGRTMAVSRFAPHLEKCMIGLGRTSGRIATRRLADLGAYLFADRSTSSASSDTASSASRSSLGEDDFEWTMASERGSSVGATKGGKRPRNAPQRKQATAAVAAVNAMAVDQRSINNSDSNGSQYLAAPLAIDPRLAPPLPPNAFATNCTPPRKQASGKRTRQPSKAARDNSQKLGSATIEPFSTTSRAQPPTPTATGGRIITNVFESIAAEMLTASNSSSGSSTNKGRQA